ncbi:MAG: hypothetical protein JRF63_15580 [Deltaproteobacteria bacterium]|nr:hypothetical protein [Deltaproteobacteria bacterium]
MFLARAAIVLVAVVVSGTVQAQGKAPAFSLSRVECDWLDQAELSRLLELELANAGAGEDLPPLTVDLMCGEQGVTIVVRDPEWTQQIERTVPTPKTEGPGRERQIALTIAQFAGALWRLREVEEQKAAERQNSAEPDIEPKPPIARPPTTVTEPPDEPGVDWFLELGGGLKGRALSSTALLTGFGELSASVWLVERVGVVGMLAIEGANADRNGGSVGAIGITAGLGIAGLLTDVGRFKLETRLLLAGGYARFDGQADDPSTHSDRSTSGGAGEVRVEIDPSLMLGRFQLALVLQAGYALPVTIAVVRTDDDVSFTGWWIGAGLRTAYSL